MIINGFGGSSNAERQLGRIARGTTGLIAVQGTSSLSAQQMYEQATGPIIHSYTVTAGTQIVCNKQGYNGVYSSPYILYGVLNDITITLPNEYQYLPCYFCFYVSEGQITSTNGWTRVAGQSYNPQGPFVVIKAAYRWHESKYVTLDDGSAFFGNYYGPCSNLFGGSAGGAQYERIGYANSNTIYAYSGWPSVRLQLLMSSEQRNASVSGQSVTYQSVKTFTLYVKIWPCQTYY